MPENPRSARRFVQFWRSEDGPTATEYAVLLGLIVAAVMMAVTGLADWVEGVFNEIPSRITYG
jgi:Flp pilus assembly pilin Flp